MNDLFRSDQDLIRSILDNNQDDFVVLMERYQQKIFAYLYRFLYRNRDAALDVTQDVFIKVYENLRSIDLTRPIQPWIYRIAHNEAANYLRTVSRKREANLEEGQWEKVSGIEEKDSLEEEETRQVILTALDRIDIKYRQVLILYFFEEKSYKEIAEIMGTSTNTVGTLISRGKKKMEKGLKHLAFIGSMVPNWMLSLCLFYAVSHQSAFSSRGMQ